MIRKGLAVLLALATCASSQAAECSRLPSVPQAPEPLAAPHAPSEAAPLPLMSLPVLAVPEAALPPSPEGPAAGPASPDSSPEAAQSRAGASFDNSGGPKRAGSLSTTGLLRGMGLSTALAAAVPLHHALHGPWAFIGAVPVAGGLLLAASRLRLRDTATDRVLPGQKVSLRRAAAQAWNRLRKGQGPAQPPRAISSWRYVAELSGLTPKFRLAGPGVWYVAGALRLSAIGSFLAWASWAPVRVAGHILQAAGLGLAAFSAYFFRDPQRVASFAPSDVASPADGRVLSVRSESPGEVTIRIFLSAFNVHVQRAPSAGKVTDMNYVRGQFVVASAPEAASKNERNSTRIEGPGGRAVIVDQLTGFVARRIASWVDPGDSVAQGQRTGMIFFGSQVAVHLPAEALVLVKPGDKVVGGRSILAQWPANQ